LKVGVFFEGVTGFFLYIIVGLVCFILLLISGVKKFFQNKCYLAAKFGTKPVDLL
jgi:Ca2+/Na+ antiporter